MKVVSSLLFGFGVFEFAEALTGNCAPEIDFNEWQSNSPPTSSYQLVQSHLFMRHGARTVASERRCWYSPYSDYEQQCPQTVIGTPYNPNIEESSTGSAGMEFIIARINDTEYVPGNCMVGQLITDGWKQGHANGQGMNQRYGQYYDIIPTTLTQSTLSTIESSFYMRADNSRRVQQTMMAFFNGLFPTDEDESSSVKSRKHSNRRNSNQRRKNQATDAPLLVPLHTMDDHWEIVFPNSNVCPQYKTNKEDSKKSKEYQDHDSVIQPLLTELNPILYGGASTPDDAMFAFDCANVGICNGWPFPPQIDQEFFDELSSNSSWYYNLYNAYPTWENATRYQVGPLLGLVRQRLLAKIEDSTSIASISDRVFLYGGHDTGPISPMLGFLKYEMQQWVPYASLITLELFQEKQTQNLFVLASFNGKPISLGEPCDSSSNPYGLCSLDKFNEYWDPVIPDSAECYHLEYSDL